MTSLLRPPPTTSDGRDKNGPVSLRHKRNEPRLPAEKHRPPLSDWDEMDSFLIIQKQSSCKATEVEPGRYDPENADSDKLSCWGGWIQGNMVRQGQVRRAIPCRDGSRGPTPRTVSSLLSTLNYSPLRMIVFKVTGRHRTPPAGGHTQRCGTWVLHPLVDKELVGLYTFACATANS